MTHPDGQYFDYRYDGLNRFIGIKENGGSDVVAQYYHATGERYVIGRGGSAVGWLYDGVGRFSYQVDDLPGGAGVNWTFERNSANQIVSSVRSNDAYAWTAHYGVARAYTTNGLNQYSGTASTTSAGPSSATLGYDANGNLTSNGGNAYVYDIENRLVGAPGGNYGDSLLNPLIRFGPRLPGAKVRPVRLSSTASHSEFGG